MIEPLDPSTDSATALAAAPDPRSRAAVLGLDYDELVRTSNRLRRGTVLVLILSMIVAETVGLLVIDGAQEGGLLGIAPGVFAAWLAGTIATLLVNVVVAKLLKLAIVTQQRIAVFVRAVVWWALIAVAIAVLRDSPAGILGLLCGTVAVAAIPILAIASLPRAIRRNHPNLAIIVLQYRQLPPEQTLLGGKVGWMLVGAAIAAAESVVVVLLFWFHPWTLIPVLIVGSVVDFWSMTWTFRRKPGRAHLIAVTLVALGTIGLATLP